MVLLALLVYLTEACASTRLWAVIGARGGGCSSYRARAWVNWENAWRWQGDWRCRPAASKLGYGVYLLLLRPPS